MTCKISGSEMMTNAIMCVHLHGRRNARIVFRQGGSTGRMRSVFFSPPFLKPGRNYDCVKSIKCYSILGTINEVKFTQV